MRIMQQDSSRKKTASAVMIILLCMCIYAACSNADSKKNGEEAGILNQESVPVQDMDETEETEKTEEKEEIESETSSGEAEQVVFTSEDLPDEIKALLNYESWTDGTQAVSCTEEDIKNSGMPEIFQQIINGDFSNVQGLRNEEEREERKKEYEKRENWAYMTWDMDGDGIEELCMKDSKGRIGMVYEVQGGSYVPGTLIWWFFGQCESNLLTEEDGRMNEFFLNNGQIAIIDKYVDENNIHYSLEMCYLSKYGTLPFVEELSIFIINDTSAGDGVNYEKLGIYYEIARDNGEEIVHEKAMEEDAIAWCEKNIYPYMMSEEEWYAVP